MEDDFFALGGTSLAALRLLGALERRRGLALPYSALIGAPTVRQLAARLRSEAPASAILPLGGGSSGPPLFLLHAADGGVGAYRALGERLDRPVLGLPDPVLDGAAPAGSIEAMAAAHAATVRAAAPGPYLLGGWSYGGVLAHAVARALRAQGEEVALVVLIDSFAPDVARRLDPLLPLPELPPAAARAFHAHRDAALRYAPGPDAGRVHVIRAAASPDGGWSALVADLREDLLPGDHDSLLQPPHVGALAAAVSALAHAALRPPEPSMATSPLDRAEPA